MAQIRLSYDSNLRYLPLVYFLPEDTIIKCPTLYALPRKFREILYDEKKMAIVESDQFLGEAMDAIADMVFPHFGFGGWKEHYTGYCPVWKLSYLLSVWAEMLEKEIGWNLQALIMIPGSESISFFDPDYIKSVMGKVGLQSIIYSLYLMWYGKCPAKKILKIGTPMLEKTF